MDKDNVKNAQLILSAIQRDEYTEDINKQIGQADAYLKRNGDKPDFYDDFIEKTITDLNTTINGCVKSRNNEKKKDDLKKYKEGYINEIVQNANDVVWTKKIAHPEIVFTVSKDDDKYFVKCTYPDAGFSLKNIYGFCTRGNSDKKSENGQEGMYGIGIKSLFCFVDELHILSNINIDVMSSEKLLDTISLEKNKDFNGFTSLSFSFSMGEDSKHAGFNTKKLADFIDEFYKSDSVNLENLKPYLINGKDNEMIFDVRSLFFTELRGISRKYKNSIKNIIFKKANSNDEICITSDEKIIKDDADKMIKIVEIKNFYKYLFFHYKKEQISLAYEYNAKSCDEKDRLYSTYFIGTYNTTPIFEVNMGMLINTVEINSSRSGLERENEKTPEVLKTICEKGKESIAELCNLIKNDKDNNYIYVDIICRLLYVNRFHYDPSNEEMPKPKGIFDRDISCIEDTISYWVLNEKKYLLKEQYGIEQEKVTINRPPNSNDENIKELYNVYKKYIFKNEDVILYESDDYKSLSSGIQKLSSSFFTEENTWISILRLPFLKSVKDLIVNRIGGSEFTSINKYLESEGVDDSDKTLLKQLIARYKINDCFDFMGNYSEQNIGNWIFDQNTIADSQYQEKCPEYEKAYGELKKLVESHIGESQYYSSNNWNASSDWWYEGYNRDNSFDEETVFESQILQLLEILCKKYLYIGYCRDNNSKFVTNRREGIILRNRTRQTSYWYSKFHYFNLDLLNRSMITFDGFKRVRKYVDEYNKSYSDDRFKISFLKKCNIKSLKYQELDGIFNWLAEYESIENSIGLDIETINQIPKYYHGKSDLTDFIRKFIGDVNIQIHKINPANRGRKFIGFITTNELEENQIFIKWSAADHLKKMSNKKGDSNRWKNMFVYTNYDDEQGVMTLVLKELGYKDEICSYIKNYIQTGNITQLPSGEFNKFIKQKRVIYDYPFMYEDSCFQEIKNDITLASTYIILSGIMSYDEHCPFCNTIPTLNIMGTNMTELEKRNSLVAMFLADYKDDKKIYVKIICCKSCFERYKKTLTSAEIKEVAEKEFKELILKEKISDSVRSRNITTQILLSPDNWRLIKRFNGID